MDATNAAILLDLGWDEPALDAVKGDRIVAWLDGRVGSLHALTTQEYSEVIDAEPYVSIAVSATDYHEFTRDIESIRVSKGDQVRRLRSAKGWGVPDGSIVIQRHFWGDDARAAVSRLVSEPAADWMQSNTCSDAGISFDAALASLRGLYGQIAAAPAPLATAPRRQPLCDEDMSTAGELTQDVPEIGARRGDLLVLRYWGELHGAPHGRVRWLTLEDYAALEALPHEAIRDYKEHWGPNYIIRDRRRWGKRLKVWHSRLALVRPWQPERVVAIKASSDDGAIFELLCEVGGRMPTGGAR
jgi:hypothetical protein